MGILAVVACYSNPLACNVQFDAEWKYWVKNAP